jgi:spermidine synthase
MVVEEEDEDEGTKEEENEDVTPYCHHIMLDIEYVDAHYLSSEDRLTESMLQLADRCDLSMFYSTCHETESSSLICAAALENSRLAATTWPERRQIVVDLQVCAGDRDWAMGIVPVLQEVFGIKDKALQQSPHAVWAYKRRGFRDESRQYNPDDADFENLVGKRKNEKKQLASVQTPFQRVDVYEEIHEKYTYGSKNVLRNFEGEYGPRNPDGFQMDRVVLLDHVEQSMLFGEAAYHEALVHPAMFSHANPRRAAIIGGGEGATLREVLKHKTVERAVMVEIDEVMVNVSRTYLPEWSDCSNIVGSAPSCFEDSRAEIYFEDAIAWFIDRYSDHSDYKDEDCFDVIIMDALDPTSVVDFSDMLYDNEDFAGAISNALGKEGVFVLQVGEGDDEDDPPEVYGNERRLFAFRQHLLENGFRTVTEYD